MLASLFIAQPEIYYIVWRLQELICPFKCKPRHPDIYSECLYKQLAYKLQLKSFSSHKTYFYLQGLEANQEALYILFSCVYKQGKECHSYDTGIRFSLAHFFIVRMMYSTWGFPVFRKICSTSRRVSLQDQMKIPFQVKFNTLTIQKQSSACNYFKSKLMLINYLFFFCP